MHPLKNRIAEGESQQLEFKFELNSGRHIAPTISAFANTTGGTLLIGVKDNGSIAGIRMEEELYVLEAAATIYCKPTVNIEIKRWDVDGKFVLEARIPAVKERFVQAETEPGNWKIFLRVNASNRLANPVHLELWKNEGTRNQKPSVFSDKEKRVLDLFEEQKSFTLNQVSRICKFNRHTLIKTLADFIRWDLIKMEPEQSGGFRFRLLDLPDI
jgi:predicted HTH transcriptional regulator